MVSKPSSFKTNRANDFIYDPNFILPTAKDHHKYAHQALMKTAQVGIEPDFNNMFSELSHCPRQAIVMKIITNTPRYIPRTQQLDSTMKSQQACPIDVSGVDRANFFKMPTVRLSSDLLNKVVFGRDVHPKVTTPDTRTQKNKAIQTIYRESSAQTSHWKSPNYIITDNSDPEILKINFLKENLPPGMHEVEMILRARKRRTWEQLLPDVEDAASLEKRRLILQAIELDIWAFRDEEIAAIQELRMELLERMLQEILDNTASRTQGKLDRIKARLMSSHQEKIQKMKHKKSRKLRRLYRQNFGISTKYSTVNVIDEHADYKSEVYAPLMRHGEHPKRGHADIHLEQYEPLLYNVENISTLPRWLYDSKLVNAEQIKLPGRRLCIRETKWTEPVLKQLHEELKNLNQVTRLKCTLREKRQKPEALKETLFIPPDLIKEAETEELEAVLLLQCIIRGRAAQTLIYEGRDRCRELIEELQSTHFLDLSQYIQMRKRRMEVLGQQRTKMVAWERESNLEAALNQLQSHVVGSMLDFLSKELVRIKDERKAHALALLYERERRDREAAEAGRRQAEERRRREHDEMFKQVVKVHQETVDLYLQDIVTEGIEQSSTQEAKKFIRKLAEQIDVKSKEPPTVYVEKEELIADMVCHFVIPEIEKQRIRDRVKKKQQKHLRCAHEAIFNKIEKLPKPREEILTICEDVSEKDSKEEYYLEYLDNVLNGLEEETSQESAFSDVGAFNYMEESSSTDE